MKKTIVLLSIALTAFVAYLTAKFCIQLCYTDSVSDSARYNILYPTVDAAFDHNVMIIWLKMLFFNLLWAGIVALAIFLIRKEKNNIDDLYYCWPIFSFTFVGVILIPLLVNLDSTIGYWIVR